MRINLTLRIILATLDKVTIVVPEMSSKQMRSVLELMYSGTTELMSDMELNQLVCVTKTLMPGHNLSVSHVSQHCHRKRIDRCLISPIISFCLI